MIDEMGEPLGFMDIRDAISLARTKGMDVVEVAPDANPPVCRIMDFGKQKYRQKKRMHDAKKRHHTVDIKEIWFRPGIDAHDRDTKLVKAKDFLEEGFRVMLTMRFRGREKHHKHYGLKVLDGIGESLKEFGKVEQESSSVGNRIMVTLAPLKSKKG